MKNKLFILLLGTSAIHAHAQSGNYFTIDLVKLVYIQSPQNLNIESFAPNTSFSMQVGLGRYFKNRYAFAPIFWCLTPKTFTVRPSRNGSEQKGAVYYGLGYSHEWCFLNNEKNNVGIYQQATLGRFYGVQKSGETIHVNNGLGIEAGLFFKWKTGRRICLGYANWQRQVPNNDFTKDVTQHNTHNLMASFGWDVFYKKP
jgi:hypothetical protein